MSLDLLSPHDSNFKTHNRILKIETSFDFGPLFDFTSQCSDIALSAIPLSNSNVLHKRSCGFVISHI